MTTPTRSREEVLNVLLALALNNRGVVSAPEQVLRQALGRRAMPDVLIYYEGLRTVIEGKIDTGPEAQRAARHDAFERVAQGIAHIGIAALYPPSLAGLGLDQQERDLPHTTLRIAVFTEANQSDVAAWEEVDVDHISDLLRRTYERLTAGDIVRQAVDIIRPGTEEFAVILESNPASVERAIAALGIRQLSLVREAAQDDEDTDQEDST